MTDIRDIIGAAIPGADDRLCEFILWEKTPFPIGRVSARRLYKAASTFIRAKTNHIQLCDLCNNKLTDHKYSCNKCHDALRRLRE